MTTPDPFAGAPADVLNERDRLTDLIARYKDKADYLEVRVERETSTSLAFRDRELEQVGRTFNYGGNVRAMVRGKWGFVSFNDVDNLTRWLTLAIEQAAAAAAGARDSETGPWLAEIAPVVDWVVPVVAWNPADVPIADIKRLYDEYNEIMWAGAPKIASTRARYHDHTRLQFLATSDGTFIAEQKIDVASNITPTARDGDNVQYSYVGVGAANDYGVVANLHEQVRAATLHAVKLLDTEPVKGGEYTVVLAPDMTGLFAHEAFGHLSEADFTYENPQMREVLTLGKRFAGAHVNIVDGAAGLPGKRASFKYDDEGTPTQKTYLLKEGVLVGRLHSRETAAKLGEKPTGNARAMSYRFRPIVRMTNTYIEPGTTSPEDMIADVKEGLYVHRWTGGETMLEMFTFTANEGYMIRNGKLAEPVRDITLTGNLFSTLQNIDAIGSDMEWESGGGCGKGGQSGLPVTDGGPHMRIQKCVVGGR